MVDFHEIRQGSGGDVQTSELDAKLNHSMCDDEILCADRTSKDEKQLLRPFL
jgi:hypothetical protein